MYQPHFTKESFSGCILPPALAIQASLLPSNSSAINSGGPLQSDITFIQNCSICQMTKSSHQVPAGLPIPQRPWSHIAIDFVTDLPNSQGHTTILTVIDCFSKACHFTPLPKLPTAFETAEHLCNYVFWFYILPEGIVSD